MNDAEERLQVARQLHAYGKAIAGQYPRVSYILYQLAGVLVARQENWLYDWIRQGLNQDRTKGG